MEVAVSEPTSDKDGCFREKVGQPQRYGQKLNSRQRGGVAQNPGSWPDSEKGRSGKQEATFMQVQGDNHEPDSRRSDGVAQISVLEAELKHTSKDSGSVKRETISKHSQVYDQKPDFKQHNGGFTQKSVEQMLVSTQSRSDEWEASLKQNNKKPDCRQGGGGAAAGMPSSTHGRSLKEEAISKQIRKHDQKKADSKQMCGGATQYLVKQKSISTQGISNARRSGRGAQNHDPVVEPSTNGGEIEREATPHRQYYKKPQSRQSRGIAQKPVYDLKPKSKQQSRGSAQRPVSIIEQNPVPQEATYTSMQKQRYHHNSRQSGRNPTCKHCGQTNHPANDCQWKTAICKICGKIGHIDTVCWHRKPRHPYPSKDSRAVDTKARSAGVKPKPSSSQELEVTFEQTQSYNQEPYIRQGRHTSGTKLKQSPTQEGGINKEATSKQMREYDRKPDCTHQGGARGVALKPVLSIEGIEQKPTLSSVQAWGVMLGATTSRQSQNPASTKSGEDTQIDYQSEGVKLKRRQEEKSE